MTKAPKKPSITKEMLIDDAKAKVTAAATALTAAQAEFDAAGNDTDKATAQTKINSASAELKKYEGALTVLTTGATEADDLSGKQSFVALDAIKHDGQDYRAGADIELSHAEFLALSEAKVIAGNWKA